MRAPLIEVRAPGLRVRRQASLLEPGLLRIVQEIEVHAQRRAIEVSGPFWVLGLVKICKGAVRYRTAQQAVEPGGRCFGLFLPPYSIVEVELTRSRTFSTGFLLRDPLPEMPGEPAVFLVSSTRLPAGREDLLAMLVNARNFQAISPQARPSPAAAQLKQALDRCYAQPLKLALIARFLARSPAAASRLFRRSYGLTPSQYRQSLRVLESLMRLAEGQPIVDVAGEVGFGDLSRFYTHFRRIACGSPGPYLPRRSKNAKTLKG
jgi:AraC-like DNA-binding protein